MDRSAPNPIPNSLREGGERREGGGRRKQLTKEERQTGDIASNN